MKRITLAFPSLHLLWNFAQTLQTHYIQINSIERKLVCDCGEADVSRAIMQFQAEIVDEVEDRKVRLD